MIDDEEKSDQGLQEKFKDKWTRTSSDKLNQQFREENMKLLQTVEAAYDTYNSVLLKKYEKHSKIIELLSKSTVSVYMLLSSHRSQLCECLNICNRNIILSYTMHY